MAEKLEGINETHVTQGPRAILAAADALLTCPDIDTLLRRAVELGRANLGLERCSIYLLSEDGGHVVGTYGTDRHGHTIDERLRRTPKDAFWVQCLQPWQPDQPRWLIQDNVPLHDYDGQEFMLIRHGWAVATPICSSQGPLGIFFNDNALSGAPFDEARQEMAAVYCSLLGNLIENKRAEERHHATTGGMRAVLAAADELLTCRDVDTLLRRAVELGRDNLGLDRCGIFLIADDGQHVIGTYGTDRHGKTTAEWSQRLPNDPFWMQCLQPDQPRWLLRENVPLHDWYGEQFLVIRTGWMAVTPIQSSQGPVGILFNDNGRSGAAFDATRQEMTAVYCSLLGNLIERKRAEEKLRNVTTHARCILWQANVVAADGGYLWTTELSDEEAAQQVLPLDVPPGLNYRRVWVSKRHPEDESRMAVTAARALGAGKSSYTQEFRCYDKHGQLHWLFEDVALQAIRPGQWHAVGVCTDITERKEVEGQLRHVVTGAQCLLWHALVEERDAGSGHSELIWNLHMPDTEAAQRFLPLDYPPHWTYEDAWNHSKLPEDKERSGDIAGTALRSGHSGYSQEFRCLCADGKVRWLREDVHIERLTPEDHRPQRWRAVGVCTDITEHMQAEAALQAAKDQLQAVLDAVPGGVSWLSADLKYLGINRYLASAFKLDPDEFIGQEIGFLQSSPAFSDWVRQFFSEPDTTASREVESTVDGVTRTYLMIAQKYQQGEAAVFVGVDITERKQAEEQARHDAFHDKLTGLPNRALFIDRLSVAIERTKRHAEFLFAVLFLDLDRFKNINDSLGHMVGDQLLIAVARRLESCLRPGDTVARLGGDEFVLLLDNIKGDSDAMFVAERIQQEVMLPFNLGGHVINTITTSIGIAHSVTGYDRPEECLRDADTAMYRAKASGRARHEVFDTAMHQRAVALLQLEMDLRRAVESAQRGEPEFRLHYQPIVALEEGCCRDGKGARITGFEALVRWQHPERGLVPPAEFISMAEETGLIIPLGEWVLREACRQMRAWQVAYPAAAALMISVNLSSNQLSQPELVEQIEHILRETGLEAASLKLEITETVLMNNPEFAAVKLDGIKAIGVQLCLDDFGTGYSSLSYLHRFPFDILKIDRFFVSRMGVAGDNWEIVHTIATLARNLNLRVVAEGVETAEQAGQLQSMQCDYGQGYFFSKPLPADVAEALLAEELREEPDVFN